MKILDVGDPHLRPTAPARRIDDFVDAQYRKFCLVRDIALKHDAVTIINGDLFDTPESSLSTLVRYIPVLKSFPSPPLVVPGNHDTPGTSLASLHRTAFGVLASAGIIVELGHKPVKVSDTVRVFGHTYMHQDPMPKPIKNKLNILVAHEMVIQDKLWREQEEFELADAYLADNAGWDVIFCGHYHGDFIQKERGTGRYIANPGSLVRIKASFRDMAIDPGVLLYDTETRKLERISLGAPDAKTVFDMKTVEQTKTAKTEAVDEFVAAVIEEKAGDVEMHTFGTLSEVIAAHLADEQTTKPVADIVRGFFAELDCSRA